MRCDRIETGVWTRCAKRRACVCGVGAFMVFAASSSVIAPQTHGFRGQHGVGGWIGARLYRGARANVSYPRFERVIVRTPEGLRDFGDVVEEAGSSAFSASVGGAENAWIVKIKESSWNEGFWAPTTRGTGSSAEVALCSARAHPSIEGPVSVAELQEIRRLGVEGVDRENYLEFPQGKSGLIAAGTWIERKPLVIGWVINGTMVVGVGLCIWTGFGVVRDTRRHQRALKFLRDGGCGWCGYDVRGLTGGVCPECGRAARGDQEPAG
jgi:hypothetical protein